MSPHRSPLTRISAALTLVVALALIATPAHAGKVKLRIAKTTKTVDISASGYYFADDAYAAASCRANERALAPGIIDAPRHLAGQSFGPSVASGFAVGEPGRVKLRLQVLCARGAKISGKRVEGKITGGSSRAPRVTASVTCKRSYPVPAPLSSEFSPGRAAFASVPVGTTGWKVEDAGVPSSFPFSSQPALYASVNCLSKSSVKKVKMESGAVTLNAAAQSASTRVSCSGGRRALGWGVELRPFSAAIQSPSTGGWGVPYVQRAELTKRGVNFTFALPAGAQLITDSQQTAHVVCGQPR